MPVDEKRAPHVYGQEEVADTGALSQIKGDATATSRRPPCLYNRSLLLRTDTRPTGDDCLAAAGCPSARPAWDAELRKAFNPSNRITSIPVSPDVLLQTKRLKSPL